MQNTCYSCHILVKLEISRQTNPQIPNFTKILPLGGELFYKKGRTQLLTAILRMRLKRYKSLDTGKIPPDIIHARKTAKVTKPSNTLIFFKQKNSSALVAVRYNDCLLTTRATKLNVVITEVTLHNFDMVYDMI